MILMVYIPCPDPETARRLGRTLVEERLAACANVLPQMTSIYVWEGALQEESEGLLLLKTDASRWERLRDRAVELHPYDTPGVVAYPAHDANAAYTAWIKGA